MPGFAFNSLHGQVQASVGVVALLQRDSLNPIVVARRKQRKSGRIRRRLPPAPVLSQSAAAGGGRRRRHRREQVQVRSVEIIGAQIGRQDVGVAVGPHLAHHVMLLVGVRRGRGRRRGSGSPDEAIKHVEESLPKPGNEKYGVNHTALSEINPLDVVVLWIKI